jgi:hypothetical protein
MWISTLLAEEMGRRRPGKTGGEGGIRAFFRVFLVIFCLISGASPEYSVTIPVNPRVPATDSSTHSDMRLLEQLFVMDTS